jgi:hypothetical protein
MRPVLLLAAAGCAPPPPVAGAGEPSIEIVYPTPGQALELEADCSLAEPIVVDVDGIELVPPDPDNLVEGQGHWHGGISLSQPGYCVSSSTFCDDYAANELPPGLLTLFAQLQDNAHGPLDVEKSTDQVEVELVAPAGATCP